jgi:hypothetical protein
MGSRKQLFLVRTPPRSVSSSHRSSNMPARPGEDSAAGRAYRAQPERGGGIRAWAKDQGVAVSARGRIPASVVEQYEAATKGS